MAYAKGGGRYRAKLKSKLVPMKKNNNGYLVGFVRIGGSLYQLDPSASNKDGVEGWIKVTQLSRASSTSGSASGARRGGFGTKTGGYRKKKATRRRSGPRASF